MQSRRTEIGFEERGKLVIVRWPTRVTLAHCDRYVEAFNAFFAKRAPFAVVQDATGVADFPAVVRRRGADFEKAYRDEHARYLRAMAIVTHSPVIAGVATALSWMAPPPFPKKTFLTLDAAERWAASTLEPDRPERSAPSSR